MMGMKFGTMSHDTIEKYGIIPDYMSFDNRHDFVIDGEITHLIVRIAFTLGHRTKGECAGTRRKISVRLIDPATDAVVASDTVTVTMHRSGST